MIIGDENKHPQYKKFLEVGKEALQR